MADLTADHPSGTLEEQLRYWQLRRLSAAGVKEIRTRDKTVVYDPAFVEEQINSLESRIRGGSGVSRIVHGRHARR